MAQTQDLSAFVPQRWSKLIIKRIDQINVMLNTGAVNTDYEGDIRTAGDTVWVRTFGDVAMSPYRRGVDIDYSALRPGKESLQVNDSQYFAIQVDDLDQAQDDLPALQGYTSRAGVKTNNVIESKLLGFYGLTNAANRITSSGSAIAIDNTNAYTTLVSARKALNKLSVPTEGRWCVIGPEYEAALLEDSKYLIRATDMGDKIVMTGRIDGKEKPASALPGYVGRCAGFNVFMSPVVPSDGTGSYAQFGGPGVISYASQIRKVEKIRLPNTFADAVRGLLLHDGTVFAENAKAFGYILTTAA